MTGGEIEFTPITDKHPDTPQVRNFDYSSSEQDDLNAAFNSDWNNF